MKEFIYPTRANIGDEWAREMLENWEKSGKPNLCFPWILSEVHTLSRQPFWMYLYYTATKSNVEALIGKVEFRVHVVDWKTNRFAGNQIFKARYDEEGKVWFLCNSYEEIRDEHRSMVDLNSFEHAQGKNLPSAMRNSIPPVICHAKLIPIHRYP